MTAEELLDEIDDCRGPCGELCVSCPDGYYLADIREVIEGLMKENKELREKVRDLSEMVHF